MPPGSATRAIGQALALLDPAQRPAAPDVRRGYLDLLGGDAAGKPGPAQRLMLNPTVARIYERWWRPALARLLMGPAGPGAGGEHRMALEMLALAPGERVLDLACGPGNFTRPFARAAHPGLVVGLDASPPMLARAVREGVPENVAYVRADALALPFTAGSFDAVCCFGALHLFDDPLRALDEVARVLAPGGRLALLTSCRRRLPPGAADAVPRLTGVRVFSRDGLAAALRERGLGEVESRLAGVAQFVAARRPTGGRPPAPKSRRR